MYFLILDKKKLTGVQYPGMRKFSVKKKIPIRNQVYQYLREQILNGVIPPNEKLNEAKIAREIGTSRTPVREALHSLERERLINSTPSVGYTVTPMSKNQVKQICEIRTVLETLAARWAMEKAYDKLVKDLRINIMTAENEVSQGNVKVFVELDAQFHEIISRLSGSEDLLELSTFLRRQMLRYRMKSIYLADTARRAINGHKKIIEAIESKDIEAVRHAISYHLEQSLMDTLRFAFKEDNGKKDKK